MSRPSGANPCPPFQNGLTPLHVAAHYDNQKVALLLLEKGASPHATAKVSPPWGQPGGRPPRHGRGSIYLLCDGIRNVHSDQAYGEWVQGEFISGLGAVPWCRCLAEGSPEGRP